jgi:trk system potassium uptake protein
LDLRIVACILGRLSLAVGAAFLLPFFLALFYAESSRGALAAAILICAAVGGGLMLWGRLVRGNLTMREGIAITGLGWILVIFLSMIPYVAGGYLSVLDSVVESISGLSGTGATVIDHLEVLPQSILLWRGLTHWFGGLGILVIFIALLPQIGHSAVYMFNAESTGPSSERVLPRIKSMAEALFCVYLAFTAAATVVYMFCGMEPLTALDHAFSTIATGGFSTYDNNAMHFDNLATELCITFFMFISSANFGMYVRAWKRGIHVIWQDMEFRVYLGIVLVMTLLIAVNLITEMHLPGEQALRESLFQVVSLSSTTGFVSADFDVWPSFSKVCLLLLMLVGGCAGSTAGGLKVCRIALLVKSVYIIIWQKLHPRMLEHVRFGKKAAAEEILFGIGRFFFVYIMFCVLWAMLMILDGVPPLDAIGISISTMGSVGPGFGIAGATCTYSSLPDFSKVVVCISMLLGRLEIFTILAMLSPEFWRRTKGW